MRSTAGGGVRDPKGVRGLLGDDEVVPLTRDSVRGIGHLGGTILRATNRGNPFHYHRTRPDGTTEEVDRSEELIANARARGSMRSSRSVATGRWPSPSNSARRACGSSACRRPSTTMSPARSRPSASTPPVSTAIEAIDKLHTTAESHDRVIVMEVMGRSAGFIALHCGLAGSADVILIPEIPFDIDRVCKKSAPGIARAGTSRSSSRPKARFRRAGSPHGSAHPCPVRCRGWAASQAPLPADPGANRQGNPVSRAGASAAWRDADRL